MNTESCTGQPNLSTQGPADIRAVVAQSNGLAAAELVELLCADQVQRWRRGERIPAEAYLSLHPLLQGASAAAFELIYSEYVLREELGERPGPGEFLWRFPQFAERLQRQLQIHHVLETDADTSPPAEPLLPSDRSVVYRQTSPWSGLLERWPVVPGYQIIEELGRGGMGVVYKAQQAGLKRTVAVKVVLAGAHAGADERMRFQREAEGLARLQHPNIVQVYEVGEHDGLCYLVLEHVGGGTLQQHLAETPQDPREAARLLRTLADALHYAHQQGIVHRDLKPANILLQSDEAVDSSAPRVPRPLPLAPALKITDFGLAKLLETSLEVTRTGDVLGTPTYMAPEQATGDPRAITPLVDVYSLGVLLYVMLTSRPPFKGANALATLELVAQREPVPPGRFQPSIPRDLETICLKCLEKAPARRYASAADLAADLRRFLEGQPIVARPTPSWERVAKWARRRPAVAALSAAVLLLALVGLALVAWQWQRAEGEADLARRAHEDAEGKRRRAEEAEAHLAFQQGQLLCEQGDVDRGLLWFAHSLDLATRAGARRLDHPLRVNLADWSQQLSRPGRRLRHPGEVLGLTFDPAGRTLVTAGKDGHACFWEVATGKQLRSPLFQPGISGNCWIAGVAFRPGNQHIVVTAGANGVMFWDARTHWPVGLPLFHPPGCMLWGLAFTPDGRRLITGCDDGLARIWDADTHRQVGPPLRHTARAGYCTLALSPDGTMLVTAGEDGRAVRWDLASGKALEPPLRHDSWVLTAAFSRDGRQIVTGTRGGTLHVWDAGTGRPIDLPPQGSDVSSVVFTPDGRLFATGTYAGLVRLWDAATLRPVGPTMRHEASVSALAFSADGRLLACGLSNGVVRLWEPPRPRALGPRLRLPGSVHALFYTQEKDGLLVGTSKGAQWWAPDRGRPPGPLLPSGDHLFESTAVSADGRTVAVAGWARFRGTPPGRLELWDAQTGHRLVQAADLPGVVYVLAASRDGQRLFAWSGGAGGPALWDLPGRRRVRTLMAALRVTVHQAVFLPDNRTLLLGCHDGTARLWDVDADAENRPNERLTHAQSVTAVACSADGRRLLTGYRDGTVLLWDTSTRQPLGKPLHHEAEVSALAFSPDGSVLLVGGQDGSARFWDASSGQPLGQPLRHADAIRAVAFHPSGQLVATGGKDRTVQQWSVPAPPLKGDVEHLRLWSEGLTGMELDSRGTIHPLSAPALEERSKRLTTTK